MKIRCNLFINKSVIAAAIAVLITLAGATGCKDNNSAEIASFNTTIDSLKGVNDKTLTMLGASRITVDQLTSQKTQLDSLVAEKDKEIERLKAELRKWKGGGGERIAGSGRSGKSSGKGKMAGKGKKKRKGKHEKEEVQPDNSSVVNNYNEMYQTQIKTLQSQKEGMEGELAELRKKFDALKKLASIVHASNFRMEPLHVRKNGKKEKVVTKAKKMNELKIAYDIEENSITDDGNKTLYLVIKGPDGKVLSNPENKSGKFTAADGSSIDYSMTADVYVKNGKPVNDLSCIWKQTGEHAKGAYTISIYNDGHKVGAGSVTLK